MPEAMETTTNLIPIEFLVLLSLVFATIIFHKYHWPIFSKKRRSPPLPPGPIGLPIVGCLPVLLKNKANISRWMLKLMQELNTEILCIRLGGTHVIHVTSPELSREFVKKQDPVFASRPDCATSRTTSNGYLSAGLSADAGDQWRKMRRVLVHDVLSTTRHDWLHDKRCEEADHLVKYVYRQSTANAAVNVRFAGRHYTGNVMRKMVFGKRFFGKGMEDGGPGVEEMEHVESLFGVIQHIYGFAISDFLPWLEVFDLDRHTRIHAGFLGNVRKYHNPEIHKRVEMWKQGIKKVEEDCLDVMINLKDSSNNPLLSIKEIEAQIMEMMLAISDGPPNTAEWCIAEMIDKPDILKRARRELDQVVGRDRLVEESDLSELNYIKACVKEAFRLHPLAPFNLPHVPTKDTTVGGYLIPKGSHVYLSRPGLGRNPRVWENPLEYKPERHMIDETSEVSLTDPDLTILSFGIGRRGCPGTLLGSTTTIMLLARLIHAFDWSATNVDLVESQVDLLMANPLIARAEPRLDEDVYKRLLTKN